MRRGDTAKRQWEKNRLAGLEPNQIIDGGG